MVELKDVRIGDIVTVRGRVFRLDSTLARLPVGVEIETGDVRQRCGFTVDSIISVGRWPSFLARNDPREAQAGAPVPPIRRPS
jgi:hypothetical protein